MISHSNIENPIVDEAQVRKKIKRRNICEKFLFKGHSKEKNNKKNREEKQRKCFYPFYVTYNADDEEHKGKIHISPLTVSSLKQTYRRRTNTYPGKF